MALDLKKLKAAALAATPGEWDRCVGTGATEIRGGPVGDLSFPRVCRILRDDVNADENAQFIVEANPSVVLELIAEIERLRKYESPPKGRATGWQQCPKCDRQHAQLSENSALVRAHRAAE